jgi:hypothetical protein
MSYGHGGGEEEGRVIVFFFDERSKMELRRTGMAPSQLGANLDGRMHVANEQNRTEHSPGKLGF